MPIELQMSDVLNNPGKYRDLLDGSLVVLVHPRDIKLMLEIMQYIAPTPYKITLSAHCKTKTQEKRIRKAFEEYWERFSLVVFNRDSRKGHRSDVRYHNLEAAKILFSTWAIFLDSDLDNKMCIYDRDNLYGRDGASRVICVTATEWLDELFTRMDEYRDKIFFGVRDNNNWLNWDRHLYGKPVSLETSNLSGVWPVWIDNLRAYDPEYNPFLKGVEAGLRYFEDIVASYELWQRGIFVRFNDISWDGDRGGYDENNYERLRDAGAALVLTSERWMYISQKKDWGKREGGGRFVNLKLSMRGEIIEWGEDMAKTVDELMTKLVEKDPKVLEFDGGLHANAGV